MTLEDGERPRPRFRKRTEQPVGATDPEALFGELPRASNGVGALWSHQADQLRTYAEMPQETPDVALELPTGSGKTLVGLLISEWRRRTLRQRVVYVCPTKQLARQVLKKADDQGIPAVLLIGPHGTWDQAELARYTRGDAIAISTYSAIFNLNPHLNDAQTLIFDDAHAAEGFVAEAWALSVSRNDGAYEQLFDVLKDSIDPSLASRMLAPDGPTTDRSTVRLLPIGTISHHANDIAQVLALLQGDASYRFRMLQANLASCLFYVSWREFYIRPMIPPTFEHAPFTNPAQRVYLSATIGDAGELERAFGRTGIKRVPVPAAWDRTGSGRRFFVFPGLASAPTEPTANDYDSGPEVRLVGALLELAPKRLVLTPDDDSAHHIANAIKVPDDERFTARDVEAGIQPFIDAETGTLLAPNRYDGMDLAADSCRMMLMAGLPTASHLQDRFLETKLRASEVLQERIRTRVLQGAGRCTRGPQDWAVVIVAGEDILRFLCRDEVRKSLPIELQAEISFGLDQSQVPADDLLFLAKSAFEQDDIWIEDAEPELATLRRAAVRTPQPNVTELATSAAREVKAWNLAWRQDWEGATRAAIDVLEHLTAPGLRSYRALWAYLGSAWSSLSAPASNSAAERSAELLRKAHKSAEGTTWLKEIQPLPSAMLDSEPVDEESVNRVIELLNGKFKSAAKFNRLSAAMLADLNQQNATKYEQALVTLGEFLGAESFKPSGKGRADAVWLWDPMWILIEAKSEQTADGMLSMDYVRQANTQLTTMAEDREMDSPPGASISVIVSPRSIVDPDAVPIAATHLHLAPPRLILDIAHDVVRAWKELRGIGHGVASETVHPEAARIFWEHRVLPTNIRERLSKDPIRGA
ncbi:DEAD/DEAH box helicase [Glycomyces sp. NPDC047010]|uniref:DEAD/DEAH box helicase n=1 Tax=Glycomyces sp. NPDC047010 TaxID=3155023 RepID=UPI0033E39FBD